MLTIADNKGNGNAKGNCNDNGDCNGDGDGNSNGNSTTQGGRRWQITDPRHDTFGDADKQWQCQKIATKIVVAISKRRAEATDGS